MEEKCPDCGTALMLRDCPDCEGEGGGYNHWGSASLDDGAWTCERCYGERKLPYCPECGDFREEDG